MVQAALSAGCPRRGEAVGNLDASARAAGRCARYYNRFAVIVPYLAVYGN